MDIKPGIKTTEFWTSALSGLWAILAPIVLPGASAAQAAVPALVAAVYTIGRTILKSKAAPSNTVGLKVNNL